MEGEVVSEIACNRTHEAIEKRFQSVEGDVLRLWERVERLPAWAVWAMWAQGLVIGAVIGYGVKAALS